MALATSSATSSATPVDARPSLPVAPVGQAGLAVRVSSLDAGLAALVADLDPGLLVGSDAASLYASFCRLERLVGAAKTLLAPRIAESGHWESSGHRSPAGLLAELEGGSAGQARRTLDAGRSLVALPGCEEALREGRLSGPKLAEITRAAMADPSCEDRLLAGSESEPLRVVTERCRRARVHAAGSDPVAAVNSIHAGRTFATWIDPEGAFCFSGRDSAERGAKLLARLVPVAARLRADRRAAAGAGAGGHGGGSPHTSPSRSTSPHTAMPPESEGALRADALFVLVTGRMPAPPTGAGRSGATGTSTADTADTGTADTTDSAPADPSDLGGVDDLVGAPPPATVIVRVDLAALRRGRALPGELSELDGHGPVPVEVVSGLLDDAFVACVFTEAGDIRAVAHLGRTVNAHLRTALALRDRHCVVPGCGVAYTLEIDHVHPLERGGRTELDNLALLCRHHHRLKTYEGWTLERTGPTDEDPGWRFTPLAPFGQEPDLGLDRGKDPPETVPRG